MARGIIFWSRMQAGGGCGSTSYNLTRSVWSEREYLAVTNARLTRAPAKLRTRRNAQKGKTPKSATRTHLPPRGEADVERGTSG